MATKNIKKESANNVANANYKYVQCDFSCLEQCKDMKTLKEWADDIANQLKSEYAKCAKALMPKGAQTKTAAATTTTKKAAEKKSESKTADKAEKKAKKGAKKTRSLADEVAQVAITDKAALKKLGVKFVRYSEKCCVLVGDTKALHDSLVENFKGIKCITLRQGELNGTKGWIFSNNRAEQFAKLSGMKMPKAI